MIADAAHHAAAVTKGGFRRMIAKGAAVRRSGTSCARWSYSRSLRPADAADDRVWRKLEAVAHTLPSTPRSWATLAAGRAACVHHQPHSRHPWWEEPTQAAKSSAGRSESRPRRAAPHAEGSDAQNVKRRPFRPRSRSFSRLSTPCAAIRRHVDAVHDDASDQRALGGGRRSQPGADRPGREADGSHGRGPGAVGAKASGRARRACAWQFSGASALSNEGATQRVDDCRRLCGSPGGSIRKRSSGRRVSHR